jgi:benzoate membrane transport protein|tara:strand:- start:551 stop:1735 length:1185 start_codon:yes stop_codon:yes gene_type:complete
VLKDVSLSAITAGLLAVLISYSGPLVIFFQAAQNANISNEMVASWVWAVSIGAAISGIVLSILYKAPIITAWSAPGTALLITLFPDMSLNEAVGAYLISAAVLICIGVTGYFETIINLIPKGIAHAMLAGILFQFGVKAFIAVEFMPETSIIMVSSYLIFRRFLPKYCLILVLITGLFTAIITEQTNLHTVDFSLTTPMFIQPEFTFTAMLSLAVPLTLVSLTGQFLPGLTILKAAGFQIPAKSIFVGTGLVSLFTAFFGGITAVIAAITAALCTDKSAHEDPDKRYIAGISNGVFYLIGAVFAGTIISLFAALPVYFISVLAGLALLGAIGSNLLATAQESTHYEASLITFVVSASGMSYLGLGAALWGTVIGLCSYYILYKTATIFAKKKTL